MDKVELRTDVEQAIFDAFFCLKLRANEVFNPTFLQAQIQTRGIGEAQFHDALSSLEKRGMIAPVKKRPSIANLTRQKFVRLTDVGFDNLCR
jgi:hypothetical protein